MSNDPNLLTSQQQMETVNEINQTINQLTEELEKFFATIVITPSATLPKKTRKPFFPNNSDNLYPTAQKTQTQNIRKKRLNTKRQKQQGTPQYISIFPNIIFPPTTKLFSCSSNKKKFLLFFSRPNEKNNMLNTIRTLKSNQK